MASEEEFEAVADRLAQQMVDRVTDDLMSGSLDMPERLAALAQAGLSIAISAMQWCGVDRAKAMRHCIAILDSWLEQLKGLH